MFSTDIIVKNSDYFPASL